MIPSEEEYPENDLRMLLLVVLLLLLPRTGENVEKFSLLCTAFPLSVLFSESITTSMFTSTVNRPKLLHYG